MLGRWSSLACAALLVHALVGMGCAPSGSVDVDRIASVPTAPADGLNPAVRAQLDGARTAVVAALSRTEPDPDDTARKLGRLGQLFHAYELHLQAATCYDLAIEFQPDEARWHYLRGVIATLFQDLGVAEDRFRRALELVPDHVPTLVNLARILTDGGSSQAAEPLLRRALEIDAGCALAHFSLASIEAEGGDHEAARGHLAAVLKLQPDATRAYLPLAQALRGLGDEAGAAAALERRGDGVIAFDDPWLGAVADLAIGVDQLINRGLDAHRKGNLDEALNLFQAVVAEDPGNTVARLNLGAVLGQLGRLDEAAVELRAAVAADPESAKAHFNLGTVLAAQGRDGEAIGCFERTLELDPGHTGARFNLANAHRRSGQFSSSAKLYREVVSDDPGNLSAIRGLARSLALAGDPAGAIATLEEALLVRPGETSTRLDLARVLATAPPEVRDGPRALQLIEPLFAGGAVGPDLVETRAMALAASERWEEAVAVQTDLLAMAQRAGQPAVAARIAENLERYEQGRVGDPNWR